MLKKLFSRKLMLAVGTVITDVATSGQLTWKGVAATGVYVAVEGVLDALNLNKPKATHD